METALVDQTSDQFVGQWRRLVSTTNWEKGRIIHEWREALRSSDAPPAEYSDEAWSRRVGNVTPQHVGRLRRVWQRFADGRDTFPGLFWSHFQAALDWDDAEMWLEGAVQNAWSVADMRDQRGATLGISSDADEQPGDSHASEPLDEDGEPFDSSEMRVGEAHSVQDLEQAGADDEELAGYDHAQFDDASAVAAESTQPAEPSEPVRPFALLPPLPDDVNDAFEAYKLCILRHKLAGWEEITRDDMLASLDALRQLILAPAEA